MVDLSIVSGTYNRLETMKKMVQSIRNSVEGVYGVSYEIILVDGGSDDGTIEWCKNQEDVHLIEHGKLLGAVKAFNDGAFSAKGSYVILANDDIEFLEDSILKAFLYIQTHPDCGIGCFYQDRNRVNQPEHIKWHVEVMPVIREGKQSTAPYGQVCIVPKWLGDYVGWWGSYLRTYGGDNEISSRIYELGYSVDPVPGTKIHDLQLEDNLRTINNIQGSKDPKAIKGHHPDSWAWGKRWRKAKLNLVGPVIQSKPIIHPENNQKPPNKPRILYLPIYEGGWEIQKQQKHSLRDSLAKIGVVKEVDYVSYSSKPNELLAELLKISSWFSPTLILTQLHNQGVLTSRHIRELRHKNPNAIFVNWNGDYWPENLLSDEGVDLARQFDLQLTINREALVKYEELGVTAKYWQIGFEEEGNHLEFPTHPKKYDIIFLGNGYSKKRQQFGRFLKSLPYKVGIFGMGWPEEYAEGQTLYNFTEGCRLYRLSKIIVGDSQWPDTGFVSNRIFQALVAGGGAVFHQVFSDYDKLHLKHGKNIVIWRDFEHLRGLIEGYLEKPEKLEKIALEGRKIALKYHSFDFRVKELFGMLPEKPSEEKQVIVRDWRW